MQHLTEEKFNKRRLLSNYFSLVVIISLVLFLTGIMGLLLLNSKKVADHFKEQIAMTVYIKDTAKEIVVAFGAKADAKTINAAVSSKMKG